MNFVEPIRDKSMVHDIAEYLKFKNERNYIMWMMGVYSGLRISDILRLKIKEVKDRNGINIREMKTGKQRTFEINPVLKKALAEYCEGKDPDDYLIKSRQNYNRPITRSMAYKILQAAAERFGIESMGTHTMRKTFGFHFYMQYKDVVALQKIFNHADQSYTLRYIGIEQQTINEKIKQFKI
ncbi:MAG: site-specific integrase [Syntrophomonadaceae bacterium]|nr:site-specific integrase [Syntrophomonadaceae bacterium]